MADCNTWLKAEVAKDDSKYHNHICIYVNDVMIVSKNPEKYMDMIEGRCQTSKY